jgi:CubicO group peptidase (beta-lactamase class C family)
MSLYANWNRIPLACLALTLATPTQAERPDVYTHIEHVSAHVREVMKKYQVPGVSVAVFRDFRIVWAKGYGITDAATNQPVDSNTLFQAASISKPVVAVAAMRLVEQQRLDLDRNINDYLTSWKLPENDLTRATPVTMRLIMTHTAGLTVHGFKGYEAGLPIPTVPQVLDGAAPANSEAVRVTMAPGTKSEYSGGGYTILQQMMIDVTHLSFPELMRVLVLQPAGMSLSTYQQPLPDSALPIASAGHEDHGKLIAGKRHTYPEMAAAGLWTTPSDLARIAMEVQKARMGLPGAILRRDLALLMTTAAPPEGNRFGLGFETYTRKKNFFGHTGGNWGYRCMLMATVEGGNGAAVMINGDEFKAVSEIISKAVEEFEL